MGEEEKSTTNEAVEPVNASDPVPVIQRNPAERVTGYLAGMVAIANRGKTVQLERT